MIFLQILRCLFIVVLSFFSYKFFSRLLGVRKNAKAAFVVITLYLLCIDHLLLNKIEGIIIDKQGSHFLNYEFINLGINTLSKLFFIMIVIILFNGDAFKKIAVCINYYVVIEAAEFGLINFIVRILDLTQEYTKIKAPHLFFSLIYILIYIVSCLLINIISKRCENLSSNLPKKISMLLLIPSLFILFALELVVLVCGNIQVFHIAYSIESTYELHFFYNNVDIVFVVITALMGLFSSLVITFSTNNAMKQALTSQQFEMQVEHYKDLEASNQRIQSLRHDMKNHIITISGLLNDDNLSAAKEYVNALREESGIFSQGVQTGNTAVDALLNTKFMAASKLKIKFECDVKLPKLNSVSDFDLCVILSNAVDNALEACKRKSYDENFISIQSNVVKNYLIIQIKNSTEEKAMGRNTLISKKENPESHGIGLQNIKAAVEKCCGVMNIELYDNVFCLSLMLPINRLIP